MSSIMAIKITAREMKIDTVQSVLTRYGDIIKTRIGIHDTEAASEQSNGLIILHLAEEADTIDELQKELANLKHVVAKNISL